MSTLALSVFQLQDYLVGVLNDLEPTASHAQDRVRCISRLNSLLQRVIPEPAELVAFGSFESNLYTPWADLDLSLELPPPSRKRLKKNRDITVLRDVFYTLLRSGTVKDIQIITGARVPVVIFRDRKSNISCDISVDNDGGVVKSRVMKWISCMDDRCRQLILLVKRWAKTQDINDPKQGTLNSYALCQLVIFHLQNISPPILPPLKDILTGNGLDPGGCLVRGSREAFLQHCRDNIDGYALLKYSSRNSESIAGLLASFFQRFDRPPSLWKQGMAVSTYSAQWKDMSSQSLKEYHMNIEDPFDPVQNCARSIQSFTLDSVCDKFKQAATLLKTSDSMKDIISSLFWDHSSAQHYPPPYRRTLPPTQPESEPQSQTKVQGEPKPQPQAEPPAAAPKEVIVKSMTAGKSQQSKRPLGKGKSPPAGSQQQQTVQLQHQPGPPSHQFRPTVESQLHPSVRVITHPPRSALSRRPKNQHPQTVAVRPVSQPEPRGGSHIQIRESQVPPPRQLPLNHLPPMHPPQPPIQVPDASKNAQLRMSKIQQQIGAVKGSEAGSQQPSVEPTKKSRARKKTNNGRLPSVQADRESNQPAGATLPLNQAPGSSRSDDQFGHLISGMVVSKDTISALTNQFKSVSIEEGKKSAASGTQPSPKPRVKGTAHLRHSTQEQSRRNNLAILDPGHGDDQHSVVASTFFAVAK